MTPPGFDLVREGLPAPGAFYVVVRPIPASHPITARITWLIELRHVLGFAPKAAGVVVKHAGLMHHTTLGALDTVVSSAKIHFERGDALE